MIKNTLKPVIYLAGGFRGDWHQVVVSMVQKATNASLKPSSFEPVFKDPKTKYTGQFSLVEAPKIFKEHKTYIHWDLQAIEASDICFVYMEKTNPAIGSLVELGYAKGLGKMTIAVIEHRDDADMERYFEFARGTADICFDNLDDGITYLNAIIQ